MSRIDELKTQLQDAILESEEYREYIRLNAEVSKNPDLKRRIDEFRRRNFELQYNDDCQDVDNEIAKLEQQFHDIRVQGVVRSYFAAEICLCRLVQDICSSVVDCMDFDTEFL